MDELAKVIEAAATKEWQRIRQTERWIPNTEDVRGAFVVGFARGFQAGMTIDLKGIAESLLKEVTDKDPPPPVDRSQRTLTDGSPVTPDHRELRADGMQKAYVVLSADERAKGFVRPVRRTYTHKTCGTETTMGVALAETYARDPGFYSGTFCCHCSKHFPLDQFVWTGTDEQVGS